MSVETIPNFREDFHLDDLIELLIREFEVGLSFCPDSYRWLHQKQH